MDEEVRGPLVTVAAFSHVIEADFAKSRLEADGIWCSLADEHIVIMNWMYSNAVGGVKLQVEESNLERAQQLLSEEIPEQDTDV